MPAYDRSFDPPAPIALVTLRNPATKATQVNIPMLIDSGADVSLLPQTVAENLKLEIMQETEYELAGFSGELSVAKAVKSEMLFLGRTFRGQFLLLEDETGIIGRNILNALHLTLNGPALHWELSQE